AVEPVEVAAQGGAEPDLVVGAGAGGDGEGVGGLAGHTELPGRQAGRDVLAGIAGQGQLEVVDGGGTVEGDRLEQALLNPVHQVGPAAGLEDVAAERGHHGAALGVGPAQVVADAAQVVPGQLARQRVEPLGDGGPGVQRPAEVLVKDLGGP